MENLAYYNGKFGPVDEMTVPFNDRVHFFGDGIYEATAAHNHVIYALDEHLDRFFNSAAMLDIHLPHTKEEFAAILRDMVSRVDSGDQFVYFQATRGTQDRGHVYPEDMVANFWILCIKMFYPELFLFIQFLKCFAPNKYFLRKIFNTVFLFCIK